VGAGVVTLPAAVVGLAGGPIRVLRVQLFICGGLAVPKCLLHLGVHVGGEADGTVTGWAGFSLDVRIVDAHCDYNALATLKLTIREMLNAAENTGIQGQLRLEQLAREEGWRLNKPDDPPQEPE
jgi:hypothetical protein